jgi:hypothetical protein
MRKLYSFCLVKILAHPKGGDQMANLAEVVNKHLGVMVRWPELTEVSLASAIASVLGDPTFQVELGQN